MVPDLARSYAVGSSEPGLPGICIGLGDIGRSQPSPNLQKMTNCVTPIWRRIELRARRQSRSDLPSFLRMILIHQFWQLVTRSAKLVHRPPFERQKFSGQFQAASADIFIVWFILKTRE